ncbi:unnamed protein product [Gordionus sp. m RMFG-2023]
MFNVKKGKEGTKGQKLIIQENKSTLNFYLIIIAIASLIHVASQLLFGLHSNKSYIIIVKWCMLLVAKNSSRRNFWKCRFEYKFRIIGKCQRCYNIDINYSNFSPNIKMVLAPFIISKIYISL